MILTGQTWRWDAPSNDIPDLVEGSIRSRKSTQQHAPPTNPLFENSSSHPLVVLWRPCTGSILLLALSITIGPRNCKFPFFYYPRILRLMSHKTERDDAGTCIKLWLQTSSHWRSFYPSNSWNSTYLLFKELAKLKFYHVPVSSINVNRNLKTILPSPSKLLKQESHDNPLSLNLVT